MSVILTEQTKIEVFARPNFSYTIDSRRVAKVIKKYVFKKKSPCMHTYRGLWKSKPNDIYAALVVLRANGVFVRISHNTIVI